MYIYIIVWALTRPISDGKYFMDAKFKSCILNSSISRRFGGDVMELIVQYASQPTSWEVSIFNVGDSRAIMLRANGSVELITTDAKPGVSQSVFIIK